MFFKKKTKKIGITFSTFDLFHAGHVKMLEEAKSVCDYLIVGLHIDPSVERQNKNSPVQSIVERYIQLKGCKFIDEIIPYSNEKDLEDILRVFKINVRIVGKDYINKKITAEDFCLEQGIEIYYNSRNHRFSSSNLRNQILNIKQTK